jgi:hypothetical protein
MKIFEVNLTNTIVVVAKDEKEAIELAQYVNRHEDNSPTVESAYPITKLSELNGGWDGDCIPWGEEGNPESKPLNRLLENDL